MQSHSMLSYYYCQLLIKCFTCCSLFYSELDHIAGAFLIPNTALAKKSKHNSDDDGTSSSGDGFSDGLTQGKIDGESDAKAGLPSHVSCGSEHSTSYCLGYRAGYVPAYDLWKISHSD
jgi:hypothetical protein